MTGTGIVRQHSVGSLGMSAQDAIDIARRVLATEDYQIVAVGPTAATFVRSVRPQWATIAAYVAAVPTLGLSLFGLLFRIQEQCTVSGQTSRRGTALSLSGVVTTATLHELESALRRASGQAPPGPGPGYGTGSVEAHEPFPGQGRSGPRSGATPGFLAEPPQNSPLRAAPPGRPAPSTGSEPLLPGPLLQPGSFPAAAPDPFPVAQQPDPFPVAQQPDPFPVAQQPDPFPSAHRIGIRRLSRIGIRRLSRIRSRWPSSPTRSRWPSSRIRIRRLSRIGIRRLSSRTRSRWPSSRIRSRRLSPIGIRRRRHLKPLRPPPRPRLSRWPHLRSGPPKGRRLRPGTLPPPSAGPGEPPPTWTNRTWA